MEAIRAFVACLASKTPLFTAPQPPGARNSRSSRSEPQERSKWLLEPARSRKGTRNGRSGPPQSRWGARKRCSSPPRSRCGARNGRSSPVGAAGALEMPARAPSASLGRSKWPHEPARLRWGGRNRSGPLGFAEALTLAARVRSASLGRSKWPLELAWLRWGGRNRCSGLLGRPRWGARQLKLHAKKLFENAVFGSRLALDTWLCSSILRAWICSGPR